MNVGVLGTGVVGKTIAGKLAELGHAVKLGTRDPKETLARSEKGQMGDPPVKDFLAAHPKVTLGTFAEAASHGELVVCALSGQAALPALEAAGAANLAGKTLVDISNPLDFSKGFPPSLFVGNTDSLGEQIQRAYPKTHVVKTLNTVGAHVMVAPAQLGGGDHTMFVCGNDAGAKEGVTKLLRDGFGWKDVLDLGDITAARATEALLLAWTRIFSATKNGNVAFKVVR